MFGGWSATGQMLYNSTEAFNAGIFSLSNRLRVHLKPSALSSPPVQESPHVWTVSSVIHSRNIHTRLCFVICCIICVFYEDFICRMPRPFGRGEWIDRESKLSFAVFPFIRLPVDHSGGARLQNSSLVCFFRYSTRQRLGSCRFT